MSIEHSEAIVLRGIDYSQSSRIVTFLTPHRGRVGCMAKGARRPKGGSAGVLDTFNRVEVGFLWKDGRGLQPLTDCALMNGYGGIKRNLEKGAYAAVPLELALHVARENDPSEELYVALGEGLDTLNDWTGDAAAPTCWTLLRMLAAAGFAPSVDKCGETGEAIQGPAGFSFECGITKRSPRADRRLSVVETETLRALADAVTCPDVPAPSRLVHLLAGYAERHMDLALRSPRVLQQVVGRPAPAQS